MSEPADDGVEREHADEFLSALGTAVVQWQYVELELFNIFAIVVRGRDHHVTSAIFYSVTNLTTRLEMIDAALDVALPETPSYKEWLRIRKKVTELSRKRNRLVHYMILGDMQEEGVELSLSRSIFDLRPRPIEQVRLEDLYNHSDSFDAMSKRLKTFVSSLSDVLQR